MNGLFNLLATTCPSGSVDISNISNTSCGATGLPVVNAGPSEINQILSLTFAILGAVAVLFVVIGGFRYVIAAGNPEDMSKAKNTIIYAVIGLVVAIAAEAIVSFALKYI